MIWVAVLLCCMVSFGFSGIEAGLLSMNRVRLRHRVKQKDRAAIVLNRLLAHPERQVVTVLIVTNLMSIFAVALATQELAGWLGWKGYLVALAVGLPVHLICLELLPKSLFRRFPYRAVALLSSPLQFADLMLSPVHAVGQAVVHGLFGKRPPAQQKLFVAREDFKYLTIESERTGALSKLERQMIHNVVDFRALTAAQVMVPREKVQTLPENATLEELFARSRSEDLERWPLVDSRGEIVGLVQVFDVALDGRRRGPVEAFRRRVVQTTVDEAAYSVVRKLRAARATVAVVRNKEGQTVGIVTWEDLMQRLVAKAIAE